MKVWDSLPWIILLLAIVISYGCSEHFARFEDTSQRKRTDTLINSSYSQITNHSIPEKQFDAPIHGVETPFRVNIWDAYL